MFLGRFTQRSDFLLASETSNLCCCCSHQTCVVVALYDDACLQIMKNEKDFKIGVSPADFKIGVTPEEEHHLVQISIVLS